MSVDAVSRVEQIQARVERDGQVTVGDLAHAFAVSEMTIRRDLDALAERGALRRVRGGAMALGPAPFAERFERRWLSLDLDLDAADVVEDPAREAQVGREAPDERPEADPLHGAADLDPKAPRPAQALTPPRARRRRAA